MPLSGHGTHHFRFDVAHNGFIFFLFLYPHRQFRQWYVVYVVTKKEEAKKIKHDAGLFEIRNRGSMVGGQ